MLAEFFLVSKFVSWVDSGALLVLCLLCDIEIDD